MPSSYWGLTYLARWALGATLLILSSTTCTPLVGGAALIGVVAVGAATSRCYDYLDVTVLDADGRKTCAATVTVSDGGSPSELTSCYYAPLTDGRWTLRASLAGFTDAVSTVEVDHSHDCTRHVQTVELTLNRIGAPPAPAQRILPPPRMPAEPTPVTPAQPPPASPSASTPVPPVAASTTAPGASATSAVPASSAEPPRGVFPDRSETSP